MKKLLCLFFVFVISAFKVYASNVKFVQIDSLRFSPYSQESIDNFKNVINEINQQKDLSFVIFTGNNIAKSDKKYLESFLKKAKKLRAPYYVALGHKDLNKQKGLSKANYTEIMRRVTHKNLKPNYTFTKKGVVFIVADGAKELISTPFGYYRDNVIEYIDNELTKNQKKNVVILQHFPIYPPNQNESYKTYKADEYLKMLKTHANVKAVVSGFGINSENDIDGIKHITTADYPKYRIIELIDCTSPSPTIWSTLK